MVDNIDQVNVDAVNLDDERAGAVGVSQGLTAAEVAARLGVKRQTVYAYVSRGLLTREVAADGRTSLFDPADVDRLATGRRKDDGEVQTLITTALTRIDDRTLWIRGHDLIGAVAGGLTFTGAVDLLWGVAEGSEAGDWNGAGASIPPFNPSGPASEQGQGTHPGIEPAGSPPGSGVLGDDDLLDRLRIITALASAADPLRHELSPPGVRAAGRSLITAMVRGLGPTLHPSDVVDGRPPDGRQQIDTPDPTPFSPAAELWHRLHPRPQIDDGADRPSTTGHRTRPEAGPPAVLEHELGRIRAVDIALALLIDHGLAGSTFAARIAASVRADPYAVVGAGLGALGGMLHGAASAAVHELLVEAEQDGDTAAALGRARRRLGYVPGTGHRVYRTQDPRYGALMAALVTAWGDDPRLVTVYRLRDLIAERTDAIPNVDLALGALTYLARFSPRAGEALFAVSRTAGWLAHAMEEYQEKPLRFRARARYVGA